MSLCEFQIIVVTDHTKYLTMPKADVRLHSTIVSSKSDTIIIVTDKTSGLCNFLIKLELSQLKLWLQATGKILKLPFSAKQD